MEVKPNVDLLPSLSSDLDAGEIDLFISHGLPWETHAAEGKIEPLDDLYESKMSDGTTKFADRVIDVALKSSKAGGHYYKVPWDARRGRYGVQRKNVRGERMGSTRNVRGTRGPL